MRSRPTLRRRLWRSFRAEVMNQIGIQPLSGWRKQLSKAERLSLRSGNDSARRFASPAWLRLLDWTKLKTGSRHT